MATSLVKNYSLGNERSLAELEIFSKAQAWLVYLVHGYEGPLDGMERGIPGIPDIHS